MKIVQLLSRLCFSVLLFKSNIVKYNFVRDIEATTQIYSRYDHCRDEQCHFLQLSVCLSVRPSLCLKVYLPLFLLILHKTLKLAWSRDFVKKCIGIFNDKVPRFMLYHLSFIRNRKLILIEGNPANCNIYPRWIGKNKNFGLLEA